MIKKVFTRLIYTNKDNITGIGFLVLRIGVSLSMIYLHGWPKFTNYFSANTSFPDPLGLGAETSMLLAIIAELLCSLLLMLGLLTRIAVIPLIITMLVAIMIINYGEPLIVKEKGFIFLMVYVFLFLAGSGKYSLDTMLYGYLIKSDNQMIIPTQRVRK